MEALWGRNQRLSLPVHPMTNNIPYTYARFSDQVCAMKCGFWQALGVQNHDVESRIHRWDVGLGAAGTELLFEFSWAWMYERVFYKMRIFREFCFCILLILCLLCCFFYPLNLFVGSHLKQEDNVSYPINYVFWMSYIKLIKLNWDKLNERPELSRFRVQFYKKDPSS